MTDESAPQRVLHVLNGLGGGAPLTTRSLIRGLSREGIESSVVCQIGADRALMDEIAEEVGGRVRFTSLYELHKKVRTDLWKRPFVQARQLRRTGGVLRSAAAVERFAAEQRIEMIHTNTIVNPEGARAAGALGLPHVWHVREMTGPGEPFRFWNESAFFRRRLFGRASTVVANSEVTAQRIRRAGGEPLVPLEVVPNGIDLGELLELRAPREEGPVVVGMVGSLSSRWKRHEDFIRAAAALDPSLAVEFRIFGDDPSGGGSGPDSYVAGLRTLVVDLGLRDRFEFAGHRSDPVDLYAGIDVLLHPAVSESFGRVVVEAMAACRPVVGYHAGGVGELVVDEVTGLLAPPGDVAGLTGHLDRLIRDSALRRSLGEAGRARAVSRYSAQAMTTRMIEVYRDAMTRPLAR